MTEKSAESEARQWMLSRPPAVKELMRQFPPGCYVTAAPDAPLCEEHEAFRGQFWQVVSYLEDGTLGIAPSYDEMHKRLNARPEYLILAHYAYNDDGQLQDRQWVDSILYGRKTEAELQAIAQKMARRLAMSETEHPDRLAQYCFEIIAAEGGVGSYSFDALADMIYQLLCESFPPERANDEQNHA